jgi:hypothetical protein
MLHAGAGLAAAMLGIVALSTGAMLSRLRGEDREARFQEGAMSGIAGIAVLLTGVAASRADLTATGVVLALTAIGAAALVERTTPPRRRWWATPPAYPLILLPFALAGEPGPGLAVVALYAFGTLAHAIESAREKP